jgi:hypothetical protein
MEVNGKDYPIYYGKIKHDWNHQPEHLATRSYCFPQKDMLTVMALNSNKS